MGKTNATYRQHLDRFFRDWARFRRSLRRENQEHWDSLMDRARNHAHAGHNQNPVDPKMGIVFSILVAQERRITELENELVESDD